METINDRLKLIAEHYGLHKYSEFAERTGLPHQTVSNYLKGKQKPDIDKLSVIQQAFDEVDALWLLTGKGKMLKTRSSYDFPAERTDSFAEEREKYLWEQIRIKDEEIAHLKELSGDKNKKAG